MAKIVEKVMTSLGFEMNPIHICSFYHKEKKILVVTHVDDFLCSGKRTDLKWHRKMISQEFEIKGDLLGGRAGETHEVQFLGVCGGAS